MAERAQSARVPEELWLHLRPRASALRLLLRRLCPAARGQIWRRTAKAGGARRQGAKRCRAFPADSHYGRHLPTLSGLKKSSSQLRERKRFWSMKVSVTFPGLSNLASFRSIDRHSMSVYERM